MTNSSNILLANCRPEWKEIWCYFANICGLMSTAVWFAVLVPQLFRNFRRKSVEGLSLGWALANFTAAFNNTFFVFYVKSLPLYAKVSAVYMPMLEIIMLIQFVAFTPYSTTKLVLSLICCFLWACLIIAQSVWTIYAVLEWLSITLWSVETFFQVFTNIDRRSTYGLSTSMVVLTTCGKTTDFLSTYLLVLPMQYVIMAYFSSSVAFINTLQVIWYWNKIPRDSTFAVESGPSRQLPTSEDEGIIGPAAESAESDHQVGYDQQVDEFDRFVLETTVGCNFLRVVLFILFSLMLGGFVVAVVWRTGHWVSLLAPVGVCGITGGYFLFARSSLKDRLWKTIISACPFWGQPQMPDKRERED